MCRYVKRARGGVQKEIIVLKRNGEHTETEVSRESTRTYGARTRHETMSTGDWRFASVRCYPPKQPTLPVPGSTARPLALDLHIDRPLICFPSWTVDGQNRCFSSSVCTTHLLAVEQFGAQSPGLGVAQAVGLRPPLLKALVASL